MANYTKGKWFVRESGLEDGEHELEVAYEFEAENGFILNYPIADIHDKVETGTAKANAHLISAAPDIYEALKLAQSFILKHNGKIKDSFSEQVAMACALAKAEGHKS